MKTFMACVISVICCTAPASAQDANSPDYAADCKRLGEVEDWLNGPSPAMLFGLTASPKKSAQFMSKFRSNYPYLDAMAAKYEKAYKANTIPRMGFLLWQLPKKFKTLNKWLEDYAKKAPGEIKSNLDEAVRIALQAKQEKNTSPFREEYGSVTQRREWARTQLRHWNVIKGEEDPELLKSKAYFSEKRKIIDEAEESLAAELLANTKTPPDVYTGDDKSKFLGMVTAKWKELYPEDQILAVRFRMTEFERAAEWKWNGSEWYKLDTSIMEVKVLVKKNDTICLIYSCFINVNHMQGDKLTIGAKTKGTSYIVKKMLMKNLKL